jgi:hypothetical protein
MPGSAKYLPLSLINRRISILRRQDSDDNVSDNRYYDKARRINQDERNQW